jgi:hypothetical protein
MAAMKAKQTLNHRQKKTDGRLKAAATWASQMPLCRCLCSGNLKVAIRHLPPNYLPWPSILRPPIAFFQAGSHGTSATGHSVHTPVNDPDNG